MGRSFNSVEKLVPPFLLIDQRVVNVPAGSHLRVQNYHFKFICLVEGNFRLEMEGLKPARISPGDALVVPSRCIHHYFPLRTNRAERLQAIRILFDPDYVPPIDTPAARKSPAARNPETDFCAFILHHFGSPMHLPQINRGEIGEILRRIRAESEAKNSGYRHAIGGLLTRFSILLARNTAPAQIAKIETEASRQQLIVNQTKEYLTDNLDRPLSLDQIAWHLHLSGEHLARVFKQATGQTVFEFLNQLRIEKAKDYLLASNMNMAEIATATGFSSSTLFGRNFRIYAGVSPTKYRSRRADDLTFVKSAQTRNLSVRMENR